MPYLYTSAPGVTVDVSAVNIRKYPQPVYPAPVTTGTKAEREAADAANRAEAERIAAGKVKSHRFTFRDASGNAVAFLRYNMPNLDAIRAWMAETDGEKRAALLAGVTPVKGESAISPTRDQLAALAASFDRAALDAMWSAGVLVVPSLRAERASDTNKANKSLTAEQRRAAALDALFPAEPEPEPEPDVTDNASEADPA